MSESIEWPKDFHKPTLLAFYQRYAAPEMIQSDIAVGMTDFDEKWWTETGQSQYQRFWASVEKQWPDINRETFRWVSVMRALYWEVMWVRFEGPSD